MLYSPAGLDDVEVGGTKKIITHPDCARHCGDNQNFACFSTCPFEIH